jgi:hypothetical protein
MLGKAFEPAFSLITLHPQLLRGGQVLIGDIYVDASFCCRWPLSARSFSPATPGKLQKIA